MAKATKPAQQQRRGRSVREVVLEIIGRLERDYPDYIVNVEYVRHLERRLTYLRERLEQRRQRFWQTQEELKRRGKRRRVDENNTPDQTGGQHEGQYGGTVGDEAHDLNAVAARLGLTFEEAKAKLLKPARKVRVSKPDPLSRARRIVRNFDNDVAKKPDLPVPAEVTTARKFVNRANYQNRKAKTAGL
jgi:hypothetical protein